MNCRMIHSWLWKAILCKTRMPNWERGSGKYLFHHSEFKKLKPQLDWDKLILIGHSNGGDMTMLFATKYPHLINKAISMDHRRMIMPRTEKPRLYTLRGCDYDADAGVIPHKTRTGAISYESCEIGRNNA